MASLVEQLLPDSEIAGKEVTMATVRCYASTDPAEKPTLRSRELDRVIDVEAMHASGFKYLEVWAAPDLDLSQYGWVRVTENPSVYGNVLWAFPDRRVVAPEADF